MALAHPQEKPPSQDKLGSVIGVGSLPLSPTLTSMWLNGRDKHPLMMVYFQGADDWWKKIGWKVASQFGRGSTGWYELRSEQVILRAAVDTESGEVEVQTSKFKLKQNNVFVVVHTADSATPQRIIPLGEYTIPASSADQPAPVLFLQANPEIMVRIRSEAEAGTK